MTNVPHVGSVGQTNDIPGHRVRIGRAEMSDIVTLINEMQEILDEVVQDAGIDYYVVVKPGPVLELALILDEFHSPDLEEWEVPRLAGRAMAIHRQLHEEI